MSTIEMKDMIIPANFPQLYPSIIGAWSVSCLTFKRGQHWYFSCYNDHVSINNTLLMG